MPHAVAGLAAQRHIATPTSGPPAGPPADPPPVIDLTVASPQWELNGSGVWGTANPAAGDHVRFRVTLTNNGTLATPGGIQHDWTAFIDGDSQTYSDDVTTSLAPGESRVQQANGHNVDGPLINYWTATGGAHALTITANTQGRIAEANTGNNSVSTTITVTAAVGAPTLPTPSNLSVGTPASTILGWGNYSHLFQSQATYTTWVGRGWNGIAGSPNYLYAHGGAQRFRGTTAPASGSEWDWQRAIEGGGGTAAAMTAAGMLERGLGYYFRAGDHPSGGDNRAVFVNDPYDTAAWTAVIAEWANVAAFIQHVGMTCLTFDTETNSLSWDVTGYTGNTHTAAQNRARFYAIGLELGTALWAACPGLRIFWYSAYQPNGWNEKIQVVGAGATPGFYDDLEFDLMHGLLAGMAASNGTGAIIIADATFYRPANAYLSGAVDRAAYQVNNFGARAYLSRKFTQTVWNYACKGAGHLFQCGFNWISHNDDSSFYRDNVPSTSAWAGHHASNRLYSEGTAHVEYTSGFDNPLSYWAGNPRYTEAAAIAGTQSASSTTPISTPVPTITSLSASASADTVTCVCTHPYGIYSVKIYDGSTFNPASPEASYLGAATMVWSENGGSYTSSYDASYQTATYSPPGGVAAAQWFVAKVTSAKGDYKYQTVQGA